MSSRSTMLWLTVSRLKRYLECPRMDFFSSETPLPKYTDYPRLCGIETHRHARQLHDKPANPRPFWFETKSKAVRAWISRWRRGVERAWEEGKLESRNPYLETRYERVGLICIARYWDQNLKLPRPPQVEKRYEATLVPGVIGLYGIFDQVRPVSLEYIRQHRPALLVDNRLKDGYDPVVIIDLKTGAEDYTLSRRRGQDPTLKERVRRQFELHEDIQATVFTWLYEQVTGKKPVGFLWYHLRSGNLFFTYREEQDYAALYGIINHVMENIAANSWPKHVGRRCERCDFLEACRENRYFLLSYPEAPPGASDLPGIPQLLPTHMEKGVTQLRLKLKAPRRKQAAPTVAAASPGVQKIVMPSLPWNGLPAKEELKSRESTGGEKTT